MLIVLSLRLTMKWLSLRLESVMRSASKVVRTTGLSKIDGIHRDTFLHSLESPLQLKTTWIKKAKDQPWESLSGLMISKKKIAELLLVFDQEGWYLLSGVMWPSVPWLLTLTTFYLEKLLVYGMIREVLAAVQEDKVASCLHFVLQLD